MIKARAYLVYTRFKGASLYERHLLTPEIKYPEESIDTTEVISNSDSLYRLDSTNSEQAIEIQKIQ